ncbi:Ethanolamine kinase 1-like protein [Dinothrombium tinctorium]|uniref:ethanolamine kinase n=1 Tax=Dinothrombium tinctorium TaxID=1965070 RepID=A0A3S3P9H2_9ACAR|nr:Ethanolamine kinase 1-like protein [Dinothrombium tinctorium]RWS10732.1 Ethanolamine kinase 1-like protein [Dinothrombium tinctorium]
MLHEDALNIARHVKSEWKESKIHLKVFTDGITNRLVGCYTDEKPEEMILIRVYGENTHLFIDRQMEIRNMILMNKAGINPPLYCIFENGICYGYTPGQVLDENLVRQPAVCKMIAERLAFMHKLTVENDSRDLEPCLFKILRRYLDLIPDGSEINNRIPNKQHLNREVNLLEKHLSNLGSPIVFCHNDLLLKNIVLNKCNGVTFIDFEYADFNYQAFDIGNHFCEFAGVEKYTPSLYPNKEFQIKWLKNYIVVWNRLNNENKTDEMIEEQIEKLYDQQGIRN